LTASIIPVNYQSAWIAITSWNDQFIWSIKVVTFLYDLPANWIVANCSSFWYHKVVFQDNS
jgi:hypothetical protein